jgi:hypothetical protein
MNRRSFLAKLGAVVAAGLVARPLANISPPPPAPPSLPPLMFHKDAFAGLFNPSADIARQYHEGHLSWIPYDASMFPPPQRLDVLYGVGYFREPVACRVAG